MAKTNKRTKAVEEPLTKSITPSKKRKIESASVVKTKKPAVTKGDASPTAAARSRRGRPTTTKSVTTTTKTLLKVKIGSGSEPAAPTKKETKRKSTTARTKNVEDANVIASAPVTEGTSSSSTADEHQVDRVAETKKADSKKTVPKKTPSKQKRTKVDSAKPGSSSAAKISKPRPTPSGRSKKVTKSVIVDANAASTQKKRGKPAVKKKTAPVKSSASKAKVKNPPKRTQRAKVK